MIPGGGKDLTFTLYDVCSPFSARGEVSMTRRRSGSFIAGAKRGPELIRLGRFLDFNAIRNREEERRPLAKLRFEPDAAAVALDHFLAQRQADAGARILLVRVQALEDDEDALGELRVDADAVVAHGKAPAELHLLGVDAHVWDAAAAELAAAQPPAAPQAAVNADEKKPGLVAQYGIHAIIALAGLVLSALILKTMVLAE